MEVNSVRVARIPVERKYAWSVTSKLDSTTLFSSLGALQETRETANLTTD